MKLKLIVKKQQKFFEGKRNFALALALSALILSGCGKSAGDKADEAIDQNRQAAMLYNRQEYAKALSTISQVIRLDSELRRDSALGEDYLLLALCQRKMGQYDSAISAFKISLECFHVVGDQQLERRGRIALADLFYALGRFKDAQSLAADAAAEAKVFSDVPNLTHALLLVAKSSRRLQDFGRNASALEELSEVGGKELSTSELLQMKFRAAVAAGNADRVSEAFDRWKLSRIRSGDSTGLAETYAAWGFYQMSQHQLDSALRAYSQALNMIGGISSRKLQTDVLGALGVIAYRSGRFDNARLYFQEALSLARQENNVISEQLLNVIIVACDWKNGKTNPSLASEFAKRCADIRSTCGQCGFRVGQMFALYVQGFIDFRANDTAAARVSLSEALRLDAQNIMPSMEAYPVFSVVSAFLEGERSSWYDPLIQMSLGTQRYDDCVELTERANVRDLERFFSQITLSTGDIHLDHACDELRLKRNAVKLLEEDIYEELSLGKDRNLEHVTILSALYPGRLQELSDAERRLEGTNLQWLLSPRTLPLQTIRDSLSPNAALIEFVPLPNELHFLVITKDSVYERNSPITRQRLLSLISEYCSIIGDARLNHSTPNFSESAAIGREMELSSVLYNMLIEPVSTLLDKREIVYVVLPPEFGWLPYHTLRSGGPPIIAKVPISYLPTASALMLQSKKEGYVSEVVGVGHPGKTTWDVEYELKDIRSFYDKAKMLFDTTATLDHLKSMTYDLVDFSAEFDLDTEVPDNSAAILSDGTTLYGMRAVPLGEMLTISYPPAFVFSNIAPVAGGLSRYAPMLFLAGGSRTVIATMWQGERKAKKYFGEVFYTNLMAGIQASTAYQQAIGAVISNPEYSRLHRWGLYYRFGR